MRNIIFNIALSALPPYILNYTELAPKLTSTASVAQSVERWQSRVESLNVYLSDTRIYPYFKKSINI